MWNSNSCMWHWTVLCIINEQVQATTYLETCIQRPPLMLQWRMILIHRRSLYKDQLMAQRRMILIHRRSLYTGPIPWCYWSLGKPRLGSIKCGSYRYVVFIQFRACFDLLPFVSALNDELVRMLVDRDDLHMEQDSKLVDIEDLTRYTTQWENPEIICELVTFCMSISWLLYRHCLHCIFMYWVFLFVTFKDKVIISWRFFICQLVILIMLKTMVVMVISKQGELSLFLDLPIISPVKCM